MTTFFLLLISNYCTANWDQYKTAYEEPSQAVYMRCVYSQMKCWEARGERFCREVME